MPIVLDSSVALSWVLPDEFNPALDRLCDRLSDDVALVPPIWPLEIGNALLVAVKRGRLTTRDLHRLTTALRALPVEIETASTARSLDETLSLAQRYNSTTYDASYVELAQRRDVALATLDDRLRKVCSSAKVALLPS